MHGRPGVRDCSSTICGRLWPAWRPVPSHINSWCMSADVKTAADRYVVTPNNVSIDAYGVVKVSVEPVVISVPAGP
jgi:Protein of unknown function (DUF1254)